MKSFDTWNEVKKLLDTKETLPDFAERDVWWCQIGVNIGFEQDGKNEPFERPVLVLRKFNKWLFIGAPLTSKVKTDKFHFKLPDYRDDKVDSFVILSQIRVLSVKRLNRKIYRLGRGVTRDINSAIIKLNFAKNDHIKAKSPHRAGKSRMPFGNLYPNNSKSNPKSQAPKRKEQNDQT